jgi:hypothetical protein
MLPRTPGRAVPDPPYPTVQGEIVRSIQHWHFQSNSRYPQHRQRLIEVLSQAMFVGFDPLLRPKTKVNAKATFPTTKL